MTVPDLPPLSRRAFLVRGGALSAAGVAALGGVGTAGFACASFAADAPVKDTDTLNTVLALEHKAVAAYQISCDSGLLKQPAMNLAFLFQSHHKTHRDTLAAAIQKIGGTPAAPQNTAEYAKALDASLLKSQNDVLEMALKLELDTTNAYLALIPAFQDRDLAKLVARIVADDAMHWTALASTLAHPLPATALTFGA